MRDHSAYVKERPLVSAPSLNDLVDYLKSLSKFPVPVPGFDRDELMQKAGSVMVARHILRVYFPHVEEDPDHVL